MKKVLLGLCDNIHKNKEKIKLWSESFKNNSDGDVFLIAANVNENDLDVLKELNILFDTVTVENTSQINHKRLQHTKDYISKLKYDLFLVTDVFDVFFQSDPFLKMNLNEYDIFVSGEGVLVKQEPWNHDVIKKVFPEKLDICSDKEIICSGIIAGKKEQLIHLYEEMFSLCESGVDGHNIKDQAALIVLVSENLIDKLKIFNLDDGWAIHCAVSGPTQFFDSWGFRNNLKYGIPKLENYVIKNGSGNKFDIVHQFNRIPEWESNILDVHNSMKNTAVVVCTYHRTLSGSGNDSIINFKNQNLKNFYVLYDNHDNTKDDEISKHYNGANICSYDNYDFEENKFNKPISDFHFWGNHKNPKYFYAHFRMLCFYKKNPNLNYYWFFDDDVTFDGDLKGLLSSYEDNDDDFIAIQVFKKEDYNEFPNISIINSKMGGSKGHWLGLCPGPGDNFKSVEKHLGSFFPIVRFSKRALEHLLKLHEEGYYGYSEGFVPTSLASDGFKVSSMMDEFNNFNKINNFCELYHKGLKFTWEWL